MGVIFCYLLATYGLSNLLVFGSGPFNVLGKLRDYSYKILPTLGEMLECMMCTSTNIGWVLSVIDLFLIKQSQFTPFNIIFEEKSLWYLIIPLDACITSGVVWLLHTVQETLESITNQNNDGRIQNNN